MNALLYLVLFGATLQLSEAQNHAGCPCSDPSLCLPLDPPARPTVETTAYIASGADVYATNGSEWRHFDWSKIASVVEFANVQSANDSYAMMCTAHEKGARILAFTPAGSWHNRSDRSCVVHPMNWNDRSSSKWLNRTLLRETADHVGACVPAGGYDGVLFDDENTWAPGDPYRDAFQDYVCFVKAALNRTLPGNIVTMDTFFALDFEDYSKLYDGGCVDFFQPMEYGQCRAKCAPRDTTCESLPLVINRAPSPIGMLKYSLDTYTHSFGVPASALAPVFDWACLCDFRCLDASCLQADDQKTLGYGETEPLRARATRVWENTTLMTKVAVYNVSSSVGGAGPPVKRQLWFDDPETLARKYAYALAAGARGVGLWTANAALGGADPSLAMNAAMWAALPSVR